MTVPKASHDMPGQPMWRGIGATWPETSLERQVARFAKEKSDEIAVITPTMSLDWRTLDARADRLAAALIAYGLKPGDRLGWLGRNGAEFPVVLVAARRARLILLGLNWRLSAAELAGVIARAQPGLVIGDTEFAGLLPSGQPLIQTGEALDAFVETGHGERPSGHRPEDLTTIFFTSGTTGEPKALAYSAEAVEQTVFAPTTLDFSPDARLLIVAPVFHTAGWVWTQYALAGGMTQIQLPAASASAMLDAVERWGVTHAQWVPAMLDTTLAEHRTRGTRLETLRMIAYGSSPIAETLLYACIDAFGCDFSQVYGLTESVGPITHLPPDAHSGGVAGKSQATGVANPGVALRVVDDAGSDVPPGEIGEIWARLPHPQARLWSIDDVGEPVTDAAGWLHTGDVGYRDADGYLYVTDRKKDVIITGGENVYPVEVEKALAAAPGVADAAVFSLPDARWGETVVAAIIPQTGSTIDAQAVIADCRTRLAHYKCPTRIFETSCFPRNASGKVLRRALPALFGQ
jgi:acyl-CoA synthetase (AMP-forming)/AMP-acid ligase II